MAAHYDDKSFSYRQYWQGRDYEHDSEVLAIGNFLRNKHFRAAADIGGGFGRLIPVLSGFADRLTLVEPSAKQLHLAAGLLSALGSRLALVQGTAANSRLPENSQDLVMLVRVMHHLPEPQDSFRELYRILKPGGLLILEFANSHHLKARVHSLLTGRPLLLTPVERRSQINIKRRTIPFVNHAPATVFKHLTGAGFRVRKTLSVSNFRIPRLKKILPHQLLLSLEKFTQEPLAGSYFGPSIFVLAQKNDQVLASS